MAADNVATQIPVPLSVTFAPEGAIEGQGLFSVGIGGVGYLLSTLDTEAPFEFRSYELQGIPAQKPRIDDSGEPGEQTFAPWWARAQHSWHQGAGQKVLDSPDSTRFRFKRSTGFNVWELGELTLLKDTSQFQSYTDTDVHILVADQFLYWSHGGTVEAQDDIENPVDSRIHGAFAGDTVNDMTANGSTVYVAFATNGIQELDVSAGTGFTLTNTGTKSVIAWVKGRLIGAGDVSGSLAEFDLSVTTPPTQFFVHQDDDFRFTSITESGPAIYYAGFSGENSEILCSRLTAQSIPTGDSGSTVGTVRNVWEAPRGEIVKYIKGYLGSALLIGTSRGLRIATISTGEGDIDVGPLIVEAEEGLTDVDEIDVFEDFAWFAWGNYENGTKAGLGRLDLGDLSWASDVMNDSSNTDVIHTVIYKGRPVFVEDTVSNRNIVVEHLTDLVPTAELETGEIRFGTYEPKKLRYLDALVVGGGFWGFQIANDLSSFVPFASSQLPGSIVNPLAVEGTRFELKLTAQRDTVDATIGPKILEWRFRAEPTTDRKFFHFVPIMMYDFIEGLTEKTIGYNGFAQDQLNHLRTIFYNDTYVQFQDPSASTVEANDPVLCKMEDLRFKVFAPPHGARGWGGLALVILREV